jgi:aryl-alcohol dehydrogenase-like predicted oxidoreductase
MDYVDVVFAARPDYETPLEETCQAMNWIIENGLAFYWGTSEWPADRISKANELCGRLNLHKPIVEQCQHNLIARTQVEKDYRRLFSDYKYGSTVWSPLAGGLLTGKYFTSDLDAVSSTDFRYNKHKQLTRQWESFMGEGKKE